MNTKKDAERLIAVLANRLGDASLTFNAYDRCYATIEEIPFTFTYSPASKHLFIEAELGKVDEGSVSGAALEKLLAINASEESTGGGVIGINKEDGKAYLMHSIALPLPEAPGSEYSLSLLLARLIPVASWGRELLEKNTPTAPLDDSIYRNTSRV